MTSELDSISISHNKTFKIFLKFYMIDKPFKNDIKFIIQYILFYNRVWWIASMPWRHSDMILLFTKTKYSFYTLERVKLTFYSLQKSEVIMLSFSKE